MGGEGTHLDLKREFDPNATVELVKDLVAMANSGGGTIRFGVADTDTPGIDLELIPRLDGARVADQVNRYVAPRKVSVSHHVDPLPNGRAVVELRIEPSGKYPLVFSKDGQEPGGKRCVFRTGDIYVRHGARGERAAYEDIAAFIDRAVESRERQILHSLQRLVQLPEGYELTVTAPGGQTMGTPWGVLDATYERRRQHTGELLDSRTLLWCFVERRSYERNPQRWDVLIRSALRRTPTLFFWLSECRDQTVVAEILVTSLADQDRDKSDAKDAILEMGALVATDAQLEEVLGEMKKSRYAHLRRAAERWQGRGPALELFRKRVAGVQWQGSHALELDVEALEAAADSLARRCLEGPKPPPQLSRLLGDLGRVLYSRQKGAQGP